MNHRFVRIFFTVTAFFLLLTSVHAGTIKVNSSIDGAPANDGFITLREALLIANGDRTPFQSPDPDADDEVFSMGIALIVGQVGPGRTDSIQVLTNAGPMHVLVDYLPPLDDAADSISAGSATVLDGGGLAPGGFAFDMTDNFHLITGFTVQNFPGDAVRIAAQGSSILSMIVQNNGGHGFVFDGAAAIFSDVTSSVAKNNMGSGVVVRDGASSNTIQNVFSYGNMSTGVVVQGAATFGNRFISVTSGVDENEMAAGNTGYGFHIMGGAKNNVIGQLNLQAEISFISNNTMGGVLIEGAGTDGNVLDHVWVGFDKTNAAGAGNGAGHGIEVRGGAKNTAIGVLGLDRNVIISGHQGNGILITGVGTDGTTVQRTFVGGPNPDADLTGDMTNMGHGIEVADGAQGTLIGELDESQGGSVDVDFTGPGSNAVFINGSNATVPVMNTKLQFFHFGVAGDGRTGPIFGGDVIRVTGNVDTLQIGAPGHRNHAISGTGYGIRLDGPKVTNVTTFKNHVGVHFGQAVPNTMGGILITNGANNITISGEDEDGRSYIAGNNGPGLRIDATGAPPSNITIQNTWIGLDPNAIALPNMGNGIEIEGAAGTSTVSLTGIEIGREDKDLPNVISGNRDNGVRLVNVSGPRLIGNRIGTNADGDEKRANMMNGVEVENSDDITIGSTMADHTGNLISGNANAGIRIVKGSHDLKIHHNRIGTNLETDAALGNTMAGVIVEAPGPDPNQGESLIIGGVNGHLNFDENPDVFEGNIISGNENYGVLISATEQEAGQEIIRGVRIQGNHIGTNFDGSAAVKNDKSGILIRGRNAEFIVVGDFMERQRGNIISGNGENGIEVDDATGWRFWANHIGINTAKDAAIPNEMHGIKLAKTTDGAIGTLFEPYAGNTISGNAMAGVMIGDEVGDLIFSHNLIGTDPFGVGAIPNQDGVLINMTGGTGATTLEIGGENTVFTDDIPEDFNQQGNVISGNTRDGIRVEAGRAGALTELQIRGNFIGLRSSGGAERPNAMAGIRIMGETAALTRIGDKARKDFTNVISGNGEDGVVLDMGATNVEIRQNIIGLDRRSSDERPNMRHGVFIKGGAHDNLIEDNMIHFNKKNGVRVEGAGTDGNKITKNSIHGNEKRGIRVVDGANGGIAPPTFERRYVPGVSTTVMNGQTIAGGMLEVFVDRIPFESGYWGQGKKFQEGITPSVNGQGNFQITPSTVADEGMITATVTDSSGNTSEFSPFMEPLVIQTVNEDPDLLVAGKPTVFRLFGDIGKGGISRRVTGAIFANDTMIAGTGSPKPFAMRPFGFYNNTSGESRRQRGENSLNIIWDDPPAGMAEYEARIFSNNKEVGSITGPLNFQSTNNVGMLLVIFDTSRLTGSGRVQPDGSAMAEAAYYFSAVYPIDPHDFRRQLTVRSTPFVVSLGFRNFIRLHDLQEDIDEFRANTTLRGGGAPDYVVGFVSVLGGLNSENTLHGSNAGGYPRSVMVLDYFPTSGSNRVSTGPALSHEIGHGPPNFFSDTYANGSRGDNNPLPSDPTKFDDTGVIIFEEDYAYSPTDNFKSALFDGPVWNTSATRFGAHDFMGNGNKGWVDPTTYKTMFVNQGGSVPSGKSRRAPVRKTIVDPAIMIQGRFGPGTTATLEPIIRPMAPQPRNPAPANGAVVLTLDLEDAGGNVLDTQDFSPDFDVETLGVDVDTQEGFGVHDTLDSVGFGIVLRDDPAATRLALRQGATELAFLALSPAVPVVTLIGPHGPGELPPGDIQVTWTATDADPGQTENLEVDVLYTPDDGLTIMPLAIDLRSTTSLMVKTDDLPGTGPARFIVRASDGWSIGEASSDPPFTVADKAQTAMILAPGSENELAEGNLINLVGAAIDPEDGFLDGDSMVWTLNGDPTPIATGVEPVVMLPPGMQTLRLTSTDSFGHVVFDELGVDVAPAPASSNDILDFLLGLAPEPAQGDHNEDGAIDSADLIIAILLGL